MEKIQSYINDNDRLARHLGIEIVAVGLGTATARMELAEEHTNSLGMAHGATLFALADLAFAAASNSHGSVAVGVQAGIHFHHSVSSGTLTATAKEVSRSRRLASYLVEVRDASDNLVATFQAMAYRKKEVLSC
ncbi:acyl-CoA thioesterase [Desulfonatronum thiosulfatophilum]|uniref:Acyl-CoA thioesterase n=1 Tax=Desulfonatronum thiosulfatophilum TaxID=617002 RepID=A0A1G6ENP4_9BACT|nr:PaaI family thioesterase [Desulfonatronum thiosulfatophilum]SDB59119.1 acyl-CoA thioesterase [Desulfonatronum thiosulfatophilum]